jgi:hypothetical protein
MVTGYPGSAASIHEAIETEINLSYTQNRVVREDHSLGDATLPVNRLQLDGTIEDW